MWPVLLIFSIFLNSCYSERIVIIGAGSAGIAAASKLLEANVTDFRLLEAENRIGGRIHSLKIGEAFVDLGAQYVHGEKGNVVYELAKDYVRHDNGTYNVVTYYNGQKKTGDNLLNTIMEFEDFVESVDEAIVSVGERYLSRYNATILRKYENDTEMLNYAKNYIRTAEALMLSLEGSFSWYKVAQESNYENCAGDNAISWNGLGYKKIFDILLKGVSIDEKISLNKTVTQITLVDETIKISCADGTQFEADHVVFTPSLGVLKREHKKIFKPKLEEVKQTVIENLGFDGVMKVVIEFSKEWCADINFIMVWSDEEKKKLKEAIPYGPVNGDDHWLSWFTSIGLAPKNPRVLIGWFTGPMIPEIEKLSDDQLKNGTLYALQRFLGKDFNITEPISVTHSRWYNNPNFRGTYSYQTVKLLDLNITNPQMILQQPILGTNGIPRILFAGEATNPTRHSTVDGAIASGFREAERLIQLLKK